MPTAPTPDYKALVIRWFEEIWNQGRVDTIDELMSPDCLTKVEGIDKLITRDAWKDYHRAFMSAISGLHVELKLLTAEDRKVTVEWVARGTHTGPGLGIPPSGRAIAFSGLSMCEFADGQIIWGLDRWNRGEMIASLMQIRIDELRSRANLTKREAQVALLMAERFSHQEIAGQLRIKPNTARRHSERVLSKLGISRRQDVAEALGKIPGSVLARHGEDLKLV